MGATTPTSKKRPATSVTSYDFAGDVLGNSTAKSTIMIYIYIIMIYYVIYYVIASGISMMSLFGGVREKHTSWASWALDSLTPGHSSQTPAGRQMLHSTQLSVENRGRTGKQMTTTHGSCEETWRVFAFNVWDTNYKHLQTVRTVIFGIGLPSGSRCN